MSEHLTGIAVEAERRLVLAPDDWVLDIGSNDATLLKGYETAGLRRVGIDPTVAQYREFYPPGILAVPDYFSAAIYGSAAPKKAKVITAIAMVYDLQDPHSFVADIARCLDPEGIWIFEQSYLGTMLAHNAFDTICHEHLEYYSLGVLKRLLETHGLRIFDVAFNDINGGSFRIYACHDAAGFRELPIVEAVCQREKEKGLDTPEPMRRLRRWSEEFREQLRSLLGDIKAEGKTVYLYGASTKGNTLLQYCGLDRATIVAAADRNPKKWGRRTPGTDIPIISEDDARRAGPGYFLVLPWHFKEEFVAREKSFLAGGGRMIFPLPELTIV
jgi:hypothetical protein